MELLVFGSLGTDSAFADAINFADKLQNAESVALPSVWLSRRARGKAIDRLIIDYTHVERQLVAKEDKNAKRIALEVIQKKVAQFCHSVIENSARLGSIGFSSIRTVARRLKQPLSVSLHGIECPESELLGLRFASDDTNSILSKTCCKRYSDWVPITDRSVANALKNKENGPGARCAFVGVEDDEEQPDLSSLNVEELAMELYRKGRLPTEGSSQLAHGGWMVCGFKAPRCSFLHFYRL